MAKKILLARLKLVTGEGKWHEEDSGWFSKPDCLWAVCRGGLNNYFHMDEMSDDVKVYGYTKPGVDRLAIKWEDRWATKLVNGKRVTTTYEFDSLLERAYERLGVDLSQTIYVEIEDA